MPWMNTTTGEVVDGEGCPNCAQTLSECDMLISATERDVRTWKLRAAKAEKLLETQAASKHDKKAWQAALDEWQQVFPDVPKPRSTSAKSARATEFFQRLDHGALLDDVLNAIHGAKQRPYVRYGKRVESPGPGTERAVDLADIVKVSGAHSDGNFDLLCSLGAAVRGPAF